MEYKTTKLFKELRKTNLCERCGNVNRRMAVHHKDHNRLNNELDNLTVLCHRCHGNEHRSKFYKMYGINMVQFALLSGLNYHHVMNDYRKGYSIKKIISAQHKLCFKFKYGDSKYVGIYGMTLKKVCKLLDLSYEDVKTLHLKNLLHPRINEIRNKISMFLK